MSKPIDGKTALVTSGTRGIGLAIAERLRADGAAVTITGTKVDEVVPDRFAYLSTNFLDRQQIILFAEKILEIRPDIVVNNAGINKISSFEEIDLSDFEAIQRVNVTAPMMICQAALPAMKERGWGRVVNVSSVWGKISKAHRAPYSASKFALDGMTAALAAEYAPFGILANSIAPGFIDTDLTRQVLGKDGIALLREQVPAKRLGSTAEIAAFVGWLVSPENTYISGQNIAIDGGFTRV